MTLHVRYRFWYIFLLSSEKQQREMTKFKVSCGTWTHDSEFSFFSLNCNAVLTESAPGLFGYIRQIERVETIANKFWNIWKSFLRWLPRVSTKVTIWTGKTCKRSPKSVVLQSLFLNFTSKVTNIITLIFLLLDIGRCHGNKASKEWQIFSIKGPFIFYEVGGGAGGIFELSLRSCMAPLSQ